MLKPGGFLKKVFGGVNKGVKKVGGGAFGAVNKAVKGTGGAIGKAVGKVGGSLPGPTPPGFKKKKQPAAAVSRLAPGGSNPMAVSRNKGNDY